MVVSCRRVALLRLMSASSKPVTGSLQVRLRSKAPVTSPVSLVLMVTVGGGLTGVGLGCGPGVGLGLGVSV